MKGNPVYRVLKDAIQTALTFSSGNPKVHSCQRRGKCKTSLPAKGKSLVSTETHCLGIAADLLQLGAQEVTLHLRQELKINNSSKRPIL